MGHNCWSRFRCRFGEQLGSPANPLIREKNVVQIFGNRDRIVAEIFDPCQVPTGGLSERGKYIADTHGHHGMAFHGWDRNYRFLSLDGYGLGRGQRIAVTIIARGVGKPKNAEVRCRHIALERYESEIYVTLRTDRSEC